MESWLGDRKWWLWGLDCEMDRLGCDLFHGTNFEVPYLGRRPSVLTLHDLSPWMNRQWHHDAVRVRGRTPWLIGLGIATMILTVSDAVRKQAIEHFDKALPLFRSQLGHRTGDAYALLAKAYDMLGRADEAARAYENATLLTAVSELNRRYPEVATLAGRYQPAAAPAEVGA